MEILKGSAKSIFAPSTIRNLQQIQKSTVELQSKAMRHNHNFHWGSPAGSAAGIQRRWAELSKPNKEVQ